MRQLLIICLEHGADPNAVTPWTVDRAPTLFLLAFRSPLDVDMFGRFIKSGASVHGFFAPSRAPRSGIAATISADGRLRANTPGWNANSSQDAQLASVTGISLLQQLLFDFEHTTCVRRVFVVLDEYLFVGQNFPERLPSGKMQPGNLSEAFSWFAQTPLAAGQICRKEGCRRDSAWLGHPFEVVYQNLAKYSQTFRDFEKAWTAKTWIAEMPRSISKGIAEDLKVAMFHWLMEGRDAVHDRQIDLAAEMAVQQAVGGWNFLHLCALQQMPRLLQAALARVDLNAHSFAMQTNGRYTATNAEVLLLALSEQTNSLQRTPLHLAAMYDESKGLRLAEPSCFKILSSLVDDIMRSCVHCSESQDPRDLVDAFGRTPVQYATKYFHNLTHKEPSASELSTSEGVIRPKSADGGWFAGQLRNETVASGVPLSDADHRCDIREVHPAFDDIEQLVNSASPWIIRAHSQTSRDHIFSHFSNDLLHHDVFVGAYANKIVQVDDTPYGDLHRSVFSNQDDEEVASGLITSMRGVRTSSH